MNKEYLNKLKKTLRKEIEILKKIDKAVEIKFKRGIYSREEYLELKREIYLFSQHIKRILQYVKKYEMENKLANFNIPIISNYYKNKKEERKKQINTMVGDKIIIKRKLYQKLKEKNLNKKGELERKKLKDLKQIGKKKKKEFKRAINLTNLEAFNRIFTLFLEIAPNLYLWIYNYLRKFDITPFQRNLICVGYILILFFLGYLSTILLALLFLFFMGKITIFFFKKALFLLFLLGILAIVFILVYPFYSLNEKKRKINNFLPFALIHMSAISSSGINFYFVIKMIAETKEYKELSEEFQKIVSLIEDFGMSLTDALKIVSEQTPSEQLSDILRSIAYLTRSGGDITNYLHQKSQESILEYKYNKEKYTSTLDVFSDLYVILVVAIPLLFVSTISILSSFSHSSVLPKIAKFGTYILIPFLNILFIIFLKMTGEQ